MFSKQRIKERKEFIDIIEERMKLFKMKKTSNENITTGVDNSLEARKLLKEMKNGY